MIGRLGLATAGGAAVVAVWAGPAFAHVEVRADKAQAGASDVTLSFNAESESPSAGIVSLRVVLPAGIAPQDVSWVSGPKGWSLKSAADGYTVSGPAVKAHTDAAYKVKVAQLPADAGTLAFKTLQTYSDGHIDRWIELPENGAESENPAPLLKLAGAVAASPGPASPSAVPVGSVQTPAAGSVTTAPVDVAAASDDSGTASWWWVLLGVVLVSIGGAVWIVRRRRDAS